MKSNVSLPLGMFSRAVVILLFLLLPLSFSIAVLAQDPLGPTPKQPRRPDDYMPRKLKTLATKSSHADARTNKEETMIVTPDILPSRVRVTFSGSTRPIPQIKKEVLRQWARLYAGAPEFYTKPYETEILFTEEGDEHWLAVKTELLPRLKQEIKEGNDVDLYLIRMGAALISDAWEPMILVENFQKPN
ncbi:MAG TPA: hypothetical protein VF074_12505 [Pyrinomonadaceae bacterium]